MPSSSMRSIFGAASRDSGCRSTASTASLDRAENWRRSFSSRWCRGSVFLKNSSARIVFEAA